MVLCQIQVSDRRSGFVFFLLLPLPGWNELLPPNRNPHVITNWNHWMMKTNRNQSNVTDKTTMTSIYTSWPYKLPSKIDSPSKSKWTETDFNWKYRWIDGRDITWHTTVALKGMSITLQASSSLFMMHWVLSDPIPSFSPLIMAFKRGNLPLLSIQTKTCQLLIDRLGITCWQFRVISVSPAAMSSIQPSPRHHLNVVKLGTTRSKWLDEHRWCCKLCFLPITAVDRQFLTPTLRRSRSPSSHSNCSGQRQVQSASRNSLQPPSTSFLFAQRSSPSSPRNIQDRFSFISFIWFLFWMF